jgi:hypothetical protein
MFLGDDDNYDGDNHDDDDNDGDDVGIFTHYQRSHIISVIQRQK